MKKLLIIPLLVLFGCSASYKAQRDTKKLDALAVQYPNETARLANWLYPCFSGQAKSDTVFSTHTDTLIADGSTVTVRLNDTVYVTKTLPGKLITKTNTVTIRDTIADGRALKASQVIYQVKSDSLVIVKTQLAAAQKLASKRFWIIIALITLIVGGLLAEAYFKLGIGRLKNFIK